MQPSMVPPVDLRSVEMTYSIGGEAVTKSHQFSKAERLNYLRSSGGASETGS